MTKSGKIQDLRDEFTITLNCLQEDEPLENCHFDADIENDLKNRLNQGDIYAWFCAEIVAEFHGVTEHAFLGSCSFDSEIDFKSYGQYYDLVLEAKGKLQGKLEKLAMELGIK